MVSKKKEESHIGKEIQSVFCQSVPGLRIYSNVVFGRMKVVSKKKAILSYWKRIRRLKIIWICPSGWQHCSLKVYSGVSIWRTLLLEKNTAAVKMALLQSSRMSLPTVHTVPPPPVAGSAGSRLVHAKVNSFEGLKGKYPETAKFCIFFLCYTFSVFKRFCLFCFFMHFLYFRKPKWPLKIMVCVQKQEKNNKFPLDTFHTQWIL